MGEEKRRSFQLRSTKPKVLKVGVGSDGRLKNSSLAHAQTQKSGCVGMVQHFMTSSNLKRTRMLVVVQNTRSTT
eukprot:4008762-Amphidinium_carterae.2